MFKHLNSNPTTTASKSLPKYTGPVIRHLIYHLWPAAYTDQWKWNLDQLLRRIHVFNGRKILGIAVDRSSVTVEEVREYLQEYIHEHDIEIFSVKNFPRLGELTTFNRMMEQLRTDDPNTLIFYAHGKGTSYKIDRIDSKQSKDATLSTVRKWTAVMYSACLDHIEQVDAALEDHLFAGSLRRFENKSWHYSGTFFWMRAAAIFARQYIVLPRQRWAIEFWPQTICSAEQAACLYADNVGRLYLPEVLDAAINSGDRSLLDLDIPEPKEGVIRPRVPSPMPNPFQATATVVSEFASNVAKYGVAKARWVASGCPKVPSEEKQIRLEICRTCEFVDGRNCGQCNCYLPDKADMATEHCPKLFWDDIQLRHKAMEAFKQKEPGAMGLPALQTTIGQSV